MQFCGANKLATANRMRVSIHIKFLDTQGHAWLTV